MYSPNDRLLAAIHTGNYEQAISCLITGARPTAIYCGRTAVGSAALTGDVEILALLIQFCEQPTLDIFRGGDHESTTSTMEIDMDMETTPTDMEKLEWVDEFDDSTFRGFPGLPAADGSNAISGDEENDDYDGDDREEVVEAHQDGSDNISLYLYYAKTFERTGAILSGLDDFYNDRTRLAIPQDTHTADSLLMTPLHYAAACGHCDCVRLLLEHDAIVDVLNSDGYTPLHLAVESLEVSRLLLKHGANPNVQTLNTGETALHLALRVRCLPVVDLLLRSNPNINATDDIDQTPLMCAILSNMDDVALELIDNSARLNLQDKEGHSAIYYAVLQNNILLVARLLQRGARVCASHYLLHHCVRYSMRHMAELLLEHTHAASLNVRNKEGVTPILLAILSQRVDMLEFLLQITAAKQDTTITDGDRQLRRIMPTISTHDHEVENELVIAVQYIDTVAEFRPIARILCAYSRGEWMMTPKNTSVSHNMTTCCYNHQTPLVRAIMLHKLDIAEFLIREGADIRQLNGPHIVNHLRSLLAPGCIEFARLLVHAGFRFPWRRANTNLANCWRTTVFGERPLPLQALTRIALRQHLTYKYLNSNDQFKSHYQTTKQESSLKRMIRELEIPKTLQIYLSDFNDCPTVIPYNHNTLQ